MTAYGVATSDVPKAATRGSAATAATHSQQDAEQQREPQAVDALGERRAQVARAQLPRHRGGRAVGEEDADRHGRGQQRAGDAEPGELGSAEVADDRRVGQQEQRLGDQGGEGGPGEPQDLPVTARGSDPGGVGIVVAPSAS